MERWPLFLVVVLSAASVDAGLITDPGSLPGPVSTVDFSQFAGTTQTTAGPVQIGALVGESIVWQSNFGNKIGDFSHVLGPNGSWNPGRGGFTALQSSSTGVFMRYEFDDGPVGGVGGFVNYNPSVGPLVIEALGTSGGVLESYNLAALAPISTPGGVNQGAFRGIVRPENDITAFVLRGAFGVLDDLTFSPLLLPPPPNELGADVTFSVINRFNGDPTGYAVIASSVAEVGNIGGTSPDIRGMAEFKLSFPELTAAVSAQLDFRVFDTLLRVPHGGTSGLPFDVTVEAYAADGRGIPTDFQSPSLGTVGTFSTSGLTPGDTLTFDVSSLYNDALANGHGLGFRLRQTNETTDYRQMGYTFGNFQINLSYAAPASSVLPEPSSFLLLSLGVIGLVAGGLRRRHKSARCGEKK